MSSMNIYKFGTTTLPHHVPSWDDSPQADVRSVAVLGGQFNPWRSDFAPVRLPRQITVSALVYESTVSALGEALDGLRALVGTRDRLWGDPFDTTEADRWCWATLRQVQSRGSHLSRLTQRVDLIFETESYWNGTGVGGGWNLDEGYYFDNGLYFDTGYSVVPGSNALANSGNRMVTNPGITYVAGGDVTNLKVHTQNCEWTISSLSNADTLIVDCGSKTVLVNGVNAYDRFALTANHASPHWFEIAANGGETVTFTNGTGSCAVTFTYSYGWY